MKKFILIVVAAFAVHFSFSQNTLTVIDTGNITRERWRDSLLRMDKNQVPTGFLLEYSMFGFDSNIKNPHIIFDNCIKRISSRDS